MTRARGGPKSLSDQLRDAVSRGDLGDPRDAVDVHKFAQAAVEADRSGRVYAEASRLAKEGVELRARRLDPALKAELNAALGLLKENPRFRGYLESEVQKWTRATTAEGLDSRPQWFFDLEGAIKKVVGYTPGIEFDFHPMADGDLELAAAWSHVRWQEDIRERLNRDHGRHSELTRMLSARHAELVAMSFYRRFYPEESVEDLSGTQLRSSEGDAWIHADIAVGERWVDVKNARRAFNNPSGYVQHIVKPKVRPGDDPFSGASDDPFEESASLNQPHQDSAQRQDIFVCGVLSPFVWAEEILGHAGRSTSDRIVVLGEIDATSAALLAGEFKSELLSVEFNRDQLTGPLRVPAWWFSLPAEVYHDRAPSVQHLRDLIKDHGSEYSGIVEADVRRILVACLAVGFPLGELAVGGKLEGWEARFVVDLGERLARLGPSLPTVFLSVLAHTLKMASSTSTPKGYRPEAVRRLVTLPELRFHPVGLFDPLMRVSDLISSLDLLWSKGGAHLLREYTRFQLTGVGILKAYSEQRGVWVTLLAYCGGRAESGAKCGHEPLVAFSDEWCERCGRLLCPKCGYCSKPCLTG